MVLNIIDLQLKVKMYKINDERTLLPGLIIAVLCFSMLYKTASITVDRRNVPVRIPNKIKTFFFTEDTTGLGSLQGNKGFNV